MIGYLVSLVMGIAVGVAHGLIQARSPAPPLIALIGLLGMVLGEQAIDMAKRHVSSFPQASVEQSNDAHGPLGPGAPPRTTATTDYVNTTKYCINLEVMSILKRRV